MKNVKSIAKSVVTVAAAPVANVVAKITNQEEIARRDRLQEKLIEINTVAMRELPLIENDAIRAEMTTYFERQIQLAVEYA